MAALTISLALLENDALTWLVRAAFCLLVDSYVLRNLCLYSHNCWDVNSCGGRECWDGSSEGDNDPLTNLDGVIFVRSWKIAFCEIVASTTLT